MGLSVCVCSNNICECFECSRARSRAAESYLKSLYSCSEQMAQSITMTARAPNAGMTRAAARTDLQDCHAPSSCETSQRITAMQAVQSQCSSGAAPVRALWGDRAGSSQQGGAWEGEQGVLWEAVAGAEQLLHSCSSSAQMLLQDMPWRPWHHGITPWHGTCMVQ